MFDAETTAFVEAGSALIVGTVHPDGTPHAGRAWALDVVEDGDRTVVRLLLDIDDLVTIDHVAGGGRTAVTASSVRTLRSLQLKGHALGLDPTRPTDDERMERYIQELFADIEDTDATERGILDRLRPRGHVAGLVEVHERFVQTPGPGAGARL